MSVEIQKFQTILSKLLTTSQKFTDEEFAPNSTVSIGGPYSKFPFRRVSEILDHIAVFADGIDPNDIRQGLLNDAYLLSAIACLAEEPTLIERLFLTEEANRAGLYALWLCDNGVWRPILLDDYLPCRQYSGAYFPAFAQCKAGEIWVPLLEKAYAKIHGSYFNMEAGLCHYAMRDFTGAPIEELYDENDADKLWDFIFNGVNNEYFLACSTELVEDKEEATEGLAKGHSYTILDAREVRSNRGEERLIMIRNPWDTFEWKGAWSNESELWTEELRRQVNYPKDEEEGIFWMNIQDYQKYFPVTWVCKYRKDNNYYSVSFNHTNTNYNVLRIKVPTRQEVTISLNQRDRRFFKNSNHPDYFYSYSRILLGKVEKNGLEYITGNASGFDRNLQATQILEPGTYLLTVEVNWNQNYHRDFNVSFYTDGELKVESLYEVDLLGVQKNIIKSAIDKFESNKTVTNYGKYGDAQIQKTVDCIHGIFYFHYENQSRKKAKLCETIKFSQISNLKICSPFTNDNQFDVTVLPGSDLLVLYKAVLDDYSWGYSASFYIQAISREDEKTPANVYTYIDDPDNKLKIEVNDDYNVYVKENINLTAEEDRTPKQHFVGHTLGRRTEQNRRHHHQQHPVEEFEEDKNQQYDKYYEDTRASAFGHQDQYYYYSNDNRTREERGEKVKSSSIQRDAQSSIGGPKRPKEYPISIMQIGQTNSKKIKYTNFDNADKQLLITSSRPDIILIKEPKINVKAGESIDLRFRFHAPKEPGYYVVKIELRSNKNPNPEEILQFPIDNRSD